MCSSSRTKCEKIIYKPYIERIKYLVRLPDDKKLCELGLIGTHSSLSYSVNEIKYQTQDLNLAQQLKYGIRVLDIGVHPQLFLFDIYSYNNKSEIEFHDFLLEADEFLNDNPGEFIIILIRQVYASAYNFVKSNCDILNFYIRHVMGGQRIVTKWRLEDTIGQHRGKLLLASLDESFSGCTFDIRRNCKLQSDITLKAKGNNYDAEDKWNDILNLIRDSYVDNHKCFINEVNFDDGKSNHRLIARDGGPLNSTTCISRPINQLMEKYFGSSHRALNIVTADFPTPELIDKINDSNFPNSSWRIGWE